MNVSALPCPKCSQLNTSNRTTCKACGINLKQLFYKEYQMKCLKPDCGFLNQKDAIYCGGCGSELRTEDIGKEKLEPKQTAYVEPQKPLYVKKKSNKKLYIICGVIAIIIALTYSGNQSGSIPPPDKMTAYFASNDFVKSNLKAPSTAKFPWFREVFVDDLGGGRYRVTAYVDAQNTFGAQIRTNYTCVVKGEDSIHWTLESIDM